MNCRLRNELLKWEVSVLESLKIRKIKKIKKNKKKYYNLFRYDLFSSTKCKQRKVLVVEKKENSNNRKMCLQQKQYSIENVFVLNLFNAYIRRNFLSFTFRLLPREMQKKSYKKKNLSVIRSSFLLAQKYNTCVLICTLWELHKIKNFFFSLH